MRDFASSLLGFETLGFLALVALAGPAIGYGAWFLTGGDGWSMGLAMLIGNLWLAFRLGRRKP